MALLRKLFYRKPPEGLFEICERVYVFDCCFTTDAWKEENYKVYIGGIVSQLQDHLPDASFLVFNFHDGSSQSQMANILSDYDMTIMDYPRHFEGCPVLTMELIHHFLRSGESWLGLGPNNVLLMHCERGGWPVLAFMLAALLIYRKFYSGEHRTLDMVYRQAPLELLHLLSPLNPIPSQLRYLQYVSRRNVALEWPPLDRALTLDCVIFRFIPNFDGAGGCRPIFRIYGQDPFLVTDRTSRVLYSTPKQSKTIRVYKQAESELIKIDINCHIQGDVVVECVSLHDDMEREQMMFRIMFNTAFIRSNILILNRDDIDTLWDVKEQFPKDFRVELLFSEMDAVTSILGGAISCFEEKEGLPMEAFAQVQEIFNYVDWLDPKTDATLNVLQQIGAPNIANEKFENYSSQNTGNGASLLETSPEHMRKSKDPLNLESTKVQTVPSLTQSTDTTVSKQETEPQGIHTAHQPPNQYDSVSEQKPQPPPLTPMEALVQVQEIFSRVAPPKQTQETNVSLKEAKPEDIHRVSQQITQFSKPIPDVVSGKVEISHSTAAHPADPDPSNLHVPSKSVSIAPSTPPPAPPSEPSVTTSALSALPSPPPPPTLAPHHFSESKPKDSSLSKETETCLRDGTQPSAPGMPSTMSGSVLPSPPSSSPYSKVASPAQPPPSPPPPPPKTPPLSENPAANSRPPPPPPPPFHLGKAGSTTDTSPVPPTMPTVPPPPPPPPFHSGKAGSTTDSSPVPPTTSTAPPPPPPPFHSGKAGSTTDSSPVPPTTPTVPPPPPPPLHSGKAGATSVPSAPPPPAGSLTGGPPPPPSTLPGSKSRLQRTNIPKNNPMKPLHWLKLSRAVSGSLWAEAEKASEDSKAPEIDISELANLFSAVAPTPDGKKSAAPGSAAPKSEKVQLIDHRRAYNCEIMLSKVKVPLHELMESVLALEDSALDADQVENIIKFCPTKEEMELLKGYKGEKEKLGKCEQFLLELMKVPRVESKLRVFSFKIQFCSQVSDLRKSLNVVNSASEEIRNSVKLKRIMQTILSLGNALNQGTARGAAIGFRLDSLLKLIDTRARNNKMTLMHYLCKVLADQLPELLDFSKDLASLEPASKIQLKFLAEEMQAVSKGLEKVVQELSTSENDGPISENFRKTLKEFLRSAEAEVRSLASLYSSVGRNVDGLILYFGEDPAKCPFEQVISTLLTFVRMFNKSHEENRKQSELEMKVVESEKVKMSASKESERVLRTPIHSSSK